MKKIFVLLISIWAPIYLVIGLLASCGNTNDERPTTEAACSPPSSQIQKQAMIGIESSFMTNDASRSYLFQ